MNRLNPTGSGIRSKHPVGEANLLANNLLAKTNIHPNNAIMILEGCQTIQRRRHFDQAPLFSIPSPPPPPFFLPLDSSVSSSTSFRIERFWRNKATCSLFHSCFREHVWWLLLPPLPIAVKYRFQDFVRVSTASTLEWRRILSRAIRVSDIAWEIPPNFWIAVRSKFVCCALQWRSISYDF